MATGRQVFISHIHEESAVAAVIREWVNKVFEGSGVTAFLSSDRDDLPPGSKWLDVVMGAVASSGVMIAVLSPESLRRPWPNIELGAAWTHNVTIIPFCHSGARADALPRPFGDFHGVNIDAVDPGRDLLTGVAAALRVKLSNTLSFARFKADITASAADLEPQAAASVADHKPAAVPKFVERAPVDAPGRFEKRNEPIGVVEAPMGIGGSKEVVLADGPAMWLRVMPDNQQAREWSLAELKANLNVDGSLLLPLGQFRAWSYVRAADGFGYVPTMANDSDRVLAVILAFRSGEVWSVYTGPLSSVHQDIPNLEPMFVDCLRRCIVFLQKGLKIERPYRWIVGIENLKGKKLWKVAPPGHYYLDPLTGPCLTDVVTDRGLLRDGDKVQLGLKPFFRKLYDACGAERLDEMDSALLAQFPD